MKAVCGLMLGALWCAGALAGEYSLSVHGLTHHFSQCKEMDHCQSVNTGLGLNVRRDNGWEFRGGFYRNSHNKKSTYLLASREGCRGAWCAGIAGGVVTGYVTYKVLPAVFPFLSYTLPGGVRLDSTFVPGLSVNHKTSPAFIGFSLEIPLGGGR